ncbi:hypothetical protein [Dyella terrae]|uniref:hypothetical protein n=1 Tax=Dyella terrae TaxID=522259 RepID=UPI001EFDCB17|nr:hypothetical protein [Dyella terrae]ULU23593.1 hypothetical protein DYST_00491 [Dyella terrae]
MPHKEVHDGLAHPVLDHCKGASAKVVALGFTCLDQVWQGQGALYRFQCRRGHVFTKNLRGLIVAVKPRCTECVQTERTERLHAMSREAGITPLMSEWLGGDVMHRFRCRHGHEWQCLGKSFLWKEVLSCPRCSIDAMRSQMLLEDGLTRLRQAAVRRGGECLATIYNGTDRRYPFRCAQGHLWSAIGTAILHQDVWCKTCFVEQSTERKFLKDGMMRIRAKAQERGGQCLDTAYEGTNARYRFRCGKGHEWQAAGASILDGGWCRICFDRGRRLGMDAAHAVARERGGQCLSTEYENANARMHWLCHRGHAWYATLGSIRAGHWCAECAHMALIAQRKSKARRRYRVAGKAESD